MRIERQDQLSTGSAITFSIPLRNDERLLGVELVETDANGLMVYDVGLIAITISNGAGLDLKYGHMGLGASLTWQGDVPTQEPYLLVGYFQSPAIGSNCSIRWMTCLKGEAGGGMSSPVNIVQTYPLGKPRIISLTGAATVTPVNFRPAVNTQWRVYNAVAWHDDPAARVCYWEIYDETNSITPNQGGVSTAQNVGLTLDSMVGITGAWQVPYFVMQHPLLLTYDVYARFNAAALAAGKVINIRALVLEFGGGS